MEYINFHYLDSDFYSDYLKYLNEKYEVVIFKLEDGSMIKKIKVFELIDENEALYKTLKMFPNCRFKLDNKSLENEYYDTSNVFVHTYLNNKYDVKLIKKDM